MAGYTCLRNLTDNLRCSHHVLTPTAPMPVLLDREMQNHRHMLSPQGAARSIWMAATAAPIRQRLLQRSLAFKRVICWLKDSESGTVAFSAALSLMRLTASRVVLSLVHAVANSDCLGCTGCFCPCVTFSEVRHKKLFPEDEGESGFNKWCNSSVSTHLYHPLNQSRRRWDALLMELYQGIIGLPYV